MNEYTAWLIEQRRKTLIAQVEEIRKQITAIENELKTIADTQQTQTPKQPGKATP